MRTALANGRRYVRHRFLRAAASVKSSFKPPVKTVDFKRFESTRSFMVLKDMAEKKGLFASMNPRSQNKKGYVYVTTQSILIMENDLANGRLSGAHLISNMRRLVDSAPREIPSFG